MRQSAIDTNLAPELNVRNEAGDTYPFTVAYVGEYWRVQDNRTGGLSSERHQLYASAEREARALKAKQQAEAAAKVQALAAASPATVETEATQPAAEPAKPTRRRKAKAEASDSVGESESAE
ncbi:hypothetical protein [Ralstonia phage phiITL-1]|uniref:Uncharacterized protein n=1 Tax=Ralstonia phage phiITL-1 TaxID=1597967 RepID=A0A0U1ZGZ9_9CAUD|nr:hypothetical protein HOR02_gp24 [Ralstonia phage phiITL-1]AJT60808.1 hypothetical protein [Ralstonia phage phiITL-1]